MDAIFFSALQHRSIRTGVCILSKCTSRIFSASIKENSLFAPTPTDTTGCVRCQLYIGQPLLGHYAHTRLQFRAAIGLSLAMFALMSRSDINDDLFLCLERKKRYQRRRLDD